MQFHVDGFKPGDPHVAPGQNDQQLNKLPSEVDVLIVGCGPAGLTLAAQLAEFADITTCIVDQKSGPLEIGQADGIACRTMEMFEAFNFSEKVLKEAYWVNETVFWKPSPNNPTHITRHQRIQDTEEGLSEFPHVILNQARVHDFYLEKMRNSAAHLNPHYNRKLVALDSKPTKRNSLNLFNNEAQFEYIDDNGQVHHETIKARYVVGCDGARSKVRQSLNLPLKGDSANQAWGVMDILAKTDFPDIRLKAVIQSANEGNLLIIPREGGFMVRLYIELEKLNKNERVANLNITKEHLVNAAKRIFAPYQLDVKEIAWWSVYEIGQRLCDKFDNVPKGAEKDLYPTGFIAGDACHTHSPKAGQGMNVSMRDSFNLGWKLVSVLRSRALPEILHTYSEERQKVAKTLIDFDKEFARLFSEPIKDSAAKSDQAANATLLQDYFQKHGRFTAGTNIQYQANLITCASTYQNLAKGFEIGTRFHSAPVIRFADAKPMHLGHVVKADGRWRLFAFNNQEDPRLNESKIVKLCNYLYTDTASPIRNDTYADDGLDAIFDIRVILQHPHRDLLLSDLPTTFFPTKGRYSLIDYEKVFCPVSDPTLDIFDLRQIDRSSGCLVIVRPDQHISALFPLNAYDEISSFFKKFMS